jgi:excisionase family DNA binding protein
MPSTATQRPQEPDIVELRRRLGGPSGQQHRGLHEIALPDRQYRLLMKIVDDLAEGKVVSLTQTSQEMTSQQAANFLGVSRQFLVRLLDDGKIAFHRVGTHRRVYLEDLVSFRDDRDRRRRAAIRQIAKQAVKDGVYNEF